MPDCCLALTVGRGGLLPRAIAPSLFSKAGNASLAIATDYKPQSTAMQRTTCRVIDDHI